MSDLERLGKHYGEVRKLEPRRERSYLDVVRSMPKLDVDRSQIMWFPRDGDADG